MRYVCNRCKRETEGIGCGELTASVDTGHTGGARKFTAAICDDCFSSLIGWFREPATTAPAAPSPQQSSPTSR